MPIIKIEHSPESLLKINDKDCDKLIQFITEFAASNQLNMHEMCTALIDTAATQVAGMDLEFGDTDGIEFLAITLGNCYKNAKQMLATGDMISMSGIPQSPHGAH